MNYTEQIDQLQTRSAAIAEKLKEIHHPEFMNLASERNAISVKIEILKQKRSGQWLPHPMHDYTQYKSPNK